MNTGLASIGLPQLVLMLVLTLILWSILRPRNPFSG